jgi:N-hydroxyarylamine O-acetyltransferase
VQYKKQYLYLFQMIDMSKGTDIIPSYSVSNSFLQNYFERIGYEGAPSADLKTLNAIHLLHTHSIPFENLNPLLHWPIKLDIESLQEKIIQNKRGGYCFEHNILLSHACKRNWF